MIDIKLENVLINKININAKDLDVLTEQAFNIDNIIMEYANENLSELKQTALHFLTTLQDLIMQYQIVFNAYNQCQEIIKKIQNENNQNNNLAFEYQKNRNILKNNSKISQLITSAYQQVDLFTIACQKALNKNAEIYYVYQSKAAKVVQVYKIQKLQDILTIQQSEHDISTRISPTKKSLQAMKSIIPKTEYSIGATQAQKLDTIYQQIIKRYNTYRYKYRSLILWDMQSRPKWHGMWLSQKGDLAESYAYFVLKGKNIKGNIPPQTPETGIESFMSIVQQVDGAFGGLQGDIEWIDINGTKHSAAIKSQGASPQALRTTIILAEQLLKSRGDEVKFLHKYKNKWKREGRNQILTFTQRQARQVLSTLNK